MNSRPFSSFDIWLFGCLVLVAVYSGSALMYLEARNIDEQQFPMWTALKIMGITVAIMGATWFAKVFLDWPRKSARYWFCLLILFNVIVILQFALAYKHLGVLEEQAVIKDGLTAFTFSLSTWSTTGFGDLMPTEQTRLLATMQSVIGYISVGIFMAMIIYTMVFDKDDEDPEFNR